MRLSRLLTPLSGVWVSYTDFADRDEFHRQVGRLPLTKGKSLLSHAACPDMTERYRKLLLRKPQQPDTLLTLEPDDDMLRHPQTVELDSMFQHVLNCEQRSQFLADLRVRENLPSSDTSVLEVPSPGVPFNYLGIPVDGDESSKDADGIVEEYDWLRKLVLDRSD